MAGRTYKEVVEDIYSAIKGLEPNGNRAMLQTILENQERARADRQEIKDDMKIIRDAVQANSTRLAICDEWRDSHMSETHGSMMKEMDRLDGRVTRWVVGNVSLTAALVAAREMVASFLSKIVP